MKINILRIEINLLDIDERFRIKTFENTGKNTERGRNIGGQQNNRV